MLILNLVSLNVAVVDSIGGSTSISFVFPKNNLSRNVVTVSFRFLDQ